MPKQPQKHYRAKVSPSTSSAHSASSKDTIAPARGKLGVMIPGMGAVATTFVAGVEAIRRAPQESRGLAMGAYTAFLAV